MERLKRKELEQLKLEKQIIANQQRQALKGLIKSQESIEITLKYTQQFLRSGNIQSLSEYSPTQISRLVFDNQLDQIKKQFEKLPNHQVKIEHFIIIMLKIMKFPFEKTPFFMVGLKDMFHQVAKENEHHITYQAFFKYILGQFVTIKQQQQNTQFQVQIQQKKKQDYLLHDNGIKRIRYSKDLKLVFSLDERANSIKIYDHQMKNIGKFSPKKEKHSNKFPFILDFDFSEINSRLGLILSDETISTVHVPNLLAKNAIEFQSNPFNELVFAVPCKMVRIFFIQMLNKWATINEQSTQLYHFDMDRVRSQPEKVMHQLKINTNDLKIKDIVEIVPLSCICLIMGNEVNFYNQNFTDFKFKKFVHVQAIQHFKYSDEKNQFYLCGKQKTITIFSLNRSGSPSKLSTFSINKIITDFQIFPYFDTIVLTDENNDVRLMHQSSKTTYHQLNYSHIVKTKNKHIQLTKLTKNQIGIFQTYLIVMNQEKIAIERDIQYSFLPYYFIDHKKQELFISVNNQIIGFSLYNGQIRNSYSTDNSNLLKHHCFFMGHKIPLFIFDNNFNLYEIFQKDEEFEGQNRTYRKKINIQDIVNCFYDEQMQNIIAVSKNSINQIRNDRNNNFNLINTISLMEFAPIIKSNFCDKSKMISFLTNDQIVYQIRNYQHKIGQGLKFSYPHDRVDHEQGLIINFHYDSVYQIIVLLTSKNEMYFINKDTNNQLYFNIEEHLPTKLKHLKFINSKYQILEEKKGHQERYLLLFDDSGFIIQFPLSKIYEEFGFKISEKDIGLKPMFKETQIITNENIPLNIIQLSQNNKIKKTYQQIGLMKAHDKSIALAIKIKIEIITTLTISIDGYIRLWNAKLECIFSLKIPSLVKIVWNMHEIEQIKNKKSVNELLSIFHQHYEGAIQEESSPIQSIQKSKRLRHNKQVSKININEPIKIQIENKDIEDIVFSKEQYSTYYSNKNKTSRTHNFLQTTQKIYAHPWRTKREFLKIYEKASPPHKYKEKIPKDLMELRTSLDMTDKLREIPTYKQAELILPQLSFYELQKPHTDKKIIPEKQNEQEGQNFESCLYVKSIKRKKKVNEFDEIDKQFKKKEMILTARKWVPKKRNERTNSVIEMKSEAIILEKQGKLDYLKSIQRVFEQHNKECLQTKKGRLIKVPNLNPIIKNLF